MYPGSYSKFQEQLFVRDAVNQYFFKSTTARSIAQFFSDFDKP